MTGKGYPKGQLCADRTILGLVCRGSYPDLHTGQNDKRTRHIVSTPVSWFRYHTVIIYNIGIQGSW